MDKRMKALLVFLLILITSCRNEILFTSKSKFEVLNEESKTAFFSREILSIVTYEGCEYFVFDSYANYTFVHKGNCKNIIHQGKGEIR